MSLDSGSTPANFAKREVEMGGIALTCTDHGTLSAAYQVYELAKKNKLQPVIGLEAYVRDDSCPILQRLGVERTPTKPKGVDEALWAEQHPDGLAYYEYLKYMHLTLHAMDAKAYYAMVKLLSAADARAERHGSETKPLFGWDQIEELASHQVTASSSCLIGMCQRHLFARNNPDAAVAYFERMHHLFGDRFYVEVFPHRCTHNWVQGVFLTSGAGEQLRFYGGKKLRVKIEDNVMELNADGLVSETLGRQQRDIQLLAVMNYRAWEEIEPVRVTKVEKIEGFVENECTPLAPGGDVQIGCNQFVLDLARKYKVPVLVSDDSHFATADEKIVQDARLAQMGNWRFHNSYHRQTSEEAFAYFEKYMGIEQSEFEGWVENSYDWVGRFKDFRFDTAPKLPTRYYPSDSLAYTKELIKRHGRWVNDPRYAARLKAEIELFHRNGVIDLLPYFFVTEEVCRTYSNQGLLTGPGRGSAAGVLLSYLIGITHVDPLKYDLSLDRFLTKDRIASGKMPDIDEDLPHRDILVGWEDIDVVEVEAEDGSKHILPTGFKLETSQGLKTVEEIVEQGIDVSPWWTARPSGDNVQADETAQDTAA